MNILAAWLLLGWYCMHGLFAEAGSSSANTVKTSKQCYKVGESIAATFSIANPKNGDWVGLTLSSSLLSGSVFYQDFLYTCGTTTCFGARASGTLSFFNNLPVGLYKAVLLPNNTFTALAVSSTFVVSSSTCQPVSTPRPVVVPKPTPTTRPVRQPTTVDPSLLAAAKQALQQASVQITSLVTNDRLLLQQFLRLLFHDCHGICDGCVDISNQDNGLLDIAINTLAPIVYQFATPQTGLSRSDIWVLAMNIALNHANQKPATRPVKFEMNWFGRVDCEKRTPNAVCTDGKGNTIPCGAMSGPKHIIAPVNMNSLDFLNFWKTNFKNISLRHAIALMGCHTVGRTFKAVSGIDGPNGWVIDNLTFNNEYFQALLGSAAKPNMTLAELLRVAPNWVQMSETNKGTALPTRHYWTLTAGGKKLIMTDGDIAFVRQLNLSNMNGATGKVGCTYTQQKRQLVCPAANTIQIAAEFLDNDVWLRTVKEGLDLMTTNGYTRGSCPTGQLCRLT